MSTKITSLEFQAILDECQEVKYKTHSSWIGGIVLRLNRLLASKPCSGACGHEHSEILPVPVPVPVKTQPACPIPVKLPPSKAIKVLVGNDVGTEEACKT